MGGMYVNAHVCSFIKHEGVGGLFVQAVLVRSGCRGLGFWVFGRCAESASNRKLCE